MGLDFEEADLLLLDFLLVDVLVFRYDKIVDSDDELNVENYLEDLF